MELKDKKCIPCHSYVPPLTHEQKLELLKNLDAAWELTQDETRLFRKFTFKSFKRPLRLTNEVARIAEEENHHPEIKLAWGLCEITIWTHTNNNLVENDFILAAKIDKSYQEIIAPT